MNAPAETPFILAPIDSIEDGPNYRKRHPKGWEEGIDELAESVRAHGLIQPIVVRLAISHREDDASAYQRVIGERRHLAAKRAGLTEIPVFVRKITDEQILELQVAENNQRENPHPLDEAEGFAALVKRGRTPAEIAAKLGRDVGYVAKRLALCKLSKKCQKALDDEAISFGVALLLARLPTEKLQDEALDDVCADRWEGAMSVDEARDLIERDFMARLADAPFDTTDAELVPKAGACSACPKRTGAQRELFSDIKSPDLCTDPPCFRSKVDALWQIRKKEAEKGGKKVLDGNAAQKALSYGGSHVSLDAEEWIDNKRVKVRKLFGKDLPETTLARDHEGRVLELVTRDDFNKALRAKHPKETPERSRDDGRAAQKRAEAKLRIRRKAIRSAIAEAVEKVRDAGVHELVELVVRAFAARVWNEVQRDVLERRGVKAKAGSVESAIVKLVKDMDKPSDVLGMGLELALRSGAPSHTYGNTAGAGAELWRDGLKLVGVNFAKHEKAAQAEAKAPKGKKAAPVHLLHADNPKGTACGSLPPKGGKLVKSLAGVTCENCKRVGPSVLASMPKKSRRRVRS